jgi:uncharacterized SAM-binding protein YcdF (DUF218 family)
VKFRSRAFWLAALTAILVAVLFHTPILTAFGSFLVRAESPRKADIAVVLAGGADGSRILTAAGLIKEGYAPLVLVSGPGGNYDWHECDLAIPFAVKRGFPETYFAHFENDAHSTAGEAAAGIAELRRRKVKSGLLVTSNYHPRRAAKIFRTGAPEISFIPIQSPDEYFTPSTWWQTREGQKTFLYEWQKTVGVWVGL